MDRKGEGASGVGEGGATGLKEGAAGGRVEEGYYLKKSGTDTSNSTNNSRFSIV